MKKKNIIIGIHPVIEAIKAWSDIDKILIQKGINKEHLIKIKTLLRNNPVPYQFVPLEKLNKITRRNHQGIIAFISPIPFHNIEDITPQLFELGRTPVILTLDRITDVRNFGAVARSAECFGADAIIIPKKETSRINEDAVKTSAGALMNIPVCRSNNLLQTLNYLKNSGIRIIAVSEKAKDTAYSLDLTVPLVLVFGSEEKGISDSILNKADKFVRIPMTGKTASLNVSVATGILLYEVLKQRS